MTLGAIVLDMPWRRFVVLLFALGFGSTLGAQNPPPRPVRPPGSTSTQCGTESSNQPVSGVAMASWVARVERDGTRALVFLVIWRGSPAWFASRSGLGNRSSGGGDCRLYHSTIQRGDLQLQVEFDSRTRLATISLAPFESRTGLATIRKKQIELRDQNVILVDGVDQGKEPQIVGTLHVDPTLPPGNSPLWLGETLRRSAETMSFLKCDTRMSDSLQQKAADIVCASVLGQ
jgi:hypothetical protein